VALVVRDVIWREVVGVGDGTPCERLLRMTGAT
jgi:hypothetical protein